MTDEEMRSRMSAMRLRDWADLRQMVRLHRADPRTYPAGWIVSRFEELDKKQMRELMEMEIDREEEKRG